MSDVELAVNVEERRPGEVAIGVLGGKPDGYAWVSAQAARTFAFALLGAARDSEDQAKLVWGDEPR